MTPPTGVQQIYFAYLSRMYAFAYMTGRRRILGLRLSVWLWLVPLVVFAYGWWRDWSPVALAPLGLLIVWLVGTFRAARRANYTRFVASDVSLTDAASTAALPDDQRIELFATGTFGVTSRETDVLLQPATYWRVPRGEHVVMVEEKPGRFLYQFFEAGTLQDVSAGWLLYGPEPREALAVEFLANWGPAFTSFTLYDRGERKSVSSTTQTIYLTFNNEADLLAVGQTIAYDLLHHRPGGNVEG